ncbi:MAG: Mov34/MPN/PAD-1 family protein [Verrucomicrobia bacterium]|nr:Mov34/MPN/PAD-1 family protein [Verrucomicrobiota bacterium]
MIVCHHRFLLLLQQPEGPVLGQLPLAPNWEPAVEWAAFAALRAGGRETPPHGRVVPVADPRLGLPYLSGFRVELDGADPAPPPCEFPVTYFARDARRGSAALVEAKKLRVGDTFSYRLIAVEQPEESSAQPAALAFEVGEETRPLAVTNAPLPPLFAATVPMGETDGSSAYPVFLPQAVLTEAQTLVEAAGAREVGGILLGHLQRDPALPDIGAVVTAQIPARHAVGEAEKLTFTPETWAAVEAAIRLRRSREIILGWWHSHPARFWCQDKACPPATRRACSLQRGFFSSDDLSLHESVFAKAFHLALVVTFADEGCHHALYGWNQGVVQRRGFRLLPDPTDSHPPPTVAGCAPPTNPHPAEAAAAPTQEPIRESPATCQPGEARLSPSPSHDFRRSFPVHFLHPRASPCRILETRQGTRNLT